VSQFTELVGGCSSVCVRFKEIFYVKMLLNETTLAVSSAMARPYRKVVVNRPAEHGIIEWARRSRKIPYVVLTYGGFSNSSVLVYQSALGKV